MTPAKMCAVKDAECRGVRLIAHALAYADIRRLEGLIDRITPITGEPMGEKGEDQ